MKLNTNSNIDGAQVLAFVGPDGISLGSGYFDENGLLTLYPTDAYISDEPRTLAIELLMSQNARFLYDDDKIIPAYYQVILDDLNLSGKYTKAELKVDFENSPISSEYVVMMQCTRNAECPTNQICTQDNVCVLDSSKNTSATQNETVQNNNSSSQSNPNTNTNTNVSSSDYNLTYALLILVIIGLAIYFLVAKNKKPKEESSKENKTQEPDT